MDSLDPGTPQSNSEGFSAPGGSVLFLERRPKHRKEVGFGGSTPEFDPSEIWVGRPWLTRSKALNRDLVMCSCVQFKVSLSSGGFVGPRPNGPGPIYRVSNKLCDGEEELKE